MYRRNKAFCEHFSCVQFGNSNKCFTKQFTVYSNSFDFHPSEWRHESRAIFKPTNQNLTDLRYTTSTNIINNNENRAQNGMLWIKRHHETNHFVFRISSWFPSFVYSFCWPKWMRKAREFPIFSSRLFFWNQHKQIHLICSKKNGCY